ncbi:F-box only protein 15-like [Xenentodon cancila]
MTTWYMCVNERDTRGTVRLTGSRDKGGGGLLPSGILMKVLSYLDASSFCISFVSKLFHRLANDEVFPKDHPAGRWEKMYFRTMAGQEMKMWKKDLKSINPYNGLPWQTEWVLRNMNVSWELRLCDHLGWECTLVPSRAHFFESSVIVCWSRASFIPYHHITSIQLYGVRKESPKSPKNCCIMTLTLLDVFQKPFWCVSSPIYITMETSPESSDYSGDHFLMEYCHADGQVTMSLVWLKELKQFFLISHTVYVPLFKVNKRFSRHY